ncbi:hypothetical protein RW64_17115 [Geobacter sulfurreducens]|nr:hypothetical protein RW64_17115 [Geobacter sulfurreducens]
MVYGMVGIHENAALPALFPVRYSDEALPGEAEAGFSGNDPCWNGASYFADDNGYLHLYVKGHPRRALHQLLWERFHRRSIPKGAAIHHVDGNPRNNSFGNLLCLPRAIHRELHGELNRLDPDLPPLLLELERYRITEFYRRRAEHYWQERGVRPAREEEECP